jgi:hypothetical protein
MMPASDESATTRKQIGDLSYGRWRDGTALHEYRPAPSSFERLLITLRYRYSFTRGDDRED